MTDRQVFTHQPERAPNHWLLVVLVAVGILLTMTVLLAGRVARGQDNLMADLDMNTVLRCTATDDAGIAACDKARNLVIFYCTSCHAFVPIVLQQFEPAGWASLINRHRGWIPNITPEDLQRIQDYLTASFNPSMDPPELPAELLELWTAY